MRSEDGRLDRNTLAPVLVILVTFITCWTNTINIPGQASALAIRLVGCRRSASSSTRRSGCAWRWSDRPVGYTRAARKAGTPHSAARVKIINAKGWAWTGCSWDRESSGGNGGSGDSRCAARRGRKCWKRGTTPVSQALGPFLIYTILAIAHLGAHVPYILPQAVRSIHTIGPEQEVEALVKLVIVVVGVKACGIAETSCNTAARMRTLNTIVAFYSSGLLVYLKLKALKRLGVFY